MRAMTAVAGVGIVFSLACGGGGGGSADGPRDDTIFLSCSDNSKKMIGEPGTAYHVHCPSMCTGGGYGTDRYTSDTKICAAGIHAGVINSSGGYFEVVLEGPGESFPGSDRNGIHMSDWNKHWGNSYSVRK